MNTKTLDLLRQGFGYALKRKLTATIVGDPGHGYVPAHRGDIDDVTRPPFAHRRQDRFHQRDGAEDIDLELAAHVFQRGFFEYAFMTIASVIHQHVNWANLVFDLRNG